MAIQTPIESLPLFLQQIFRERGVYPELNTGVDQSSSVNSFVPPRRRRLNAEGGMEGDFDEPLLPESTGSVDIINTLRGLFSSDNTDPAFQAMLTDVANQGSLVSASRGSGDYLVEPNQPSDMGYEFTTMPGDTPSENEAFLGFANSPPGPSFVKSEGQTAPNYDRSINEKTGEINPGLVDTRGQDFYDRMSQPQSLGSSFLDSVKNISDTIGKEVTEDLTKGLNSLTNLGSTLTNELSGLFSLDGLSDLFSLDSLIGSAPSIEDRYGPTGFIDAGLTALRDPYLSTGQKAGQALGGVLGAGASAVIPGANILGLFGAAMGRMGAHHDFDPSTDYNLNFDTRSGRTDWGSLSPGAGGVQYGSLSNENMIEDLAEKDPDFEISLNDGRDGYITAESWVAANEGLKAGNAAFGFNPDNPLAGYTQTDYYAAAADPGGGIMFETLDKGGTTLGEALTEYALTGTGAIQNRAGAMAGELGLGYNAQQSFADSLFDAAKTGAPLDLLTDVNLNYDIDVGAGGSVDGDSTETVDGESFDFDSDFSGFGW